MDRYKSHGTGKFKKKDFAKIGKNVVFEAGVLVFHPENIEIGSNVYIGHNTILKGYHKNKMILEDNVWIGQQSFLHSAGGIKIEHDTGLGPGVNILTATHDLTQDKRQNLIDIPLETRPVMIESGCDIGAKTTILPGVTVAKGTQVGAAAVLTKSTKPFSIVAGVPARLIRMRKKTKKG